MSEQAAPRSIGEAAAALASAAASERPVRIVGGGTKLGWGYPTPPGALRLHTGRLDRMVVAEDRMTATLSAGTALRRVQTMLAGRGLLFAADPHLGLGHRPAATVGGVVATADSGPLSHRYGPLPEQLVGITVALSDGAVVRAGPMGDDGPDGYNLTRLFSGSFGTLGAILAVDVRLHPLPGPTATAAGATSDPLLLSDAARTLAAAHPQLECVDLAWRGGRGGLLAQVAGEDAARRADTVGVAMRECGLEGTEVRADDAELWARQRAGQRSVDRAVVRLRARSEDLPEILALADETGATVVGRAALGILYLTLDVPMIARLRAGLSPGTPAVVLDLPAGSRGAIDPWGTPEDAELELNRGVKARFDSAGVCNPGLFLGRI